MGANSHLLGRYAAPLALLAVTLSAMLLAGPAGAAAEQYYQEYYRPLRLGTQIAVMWPHQIELCSIGLPAYQDYYFNPVTHIRRYGIITASHCGDYGDDVYQEYYGPNKLIGYIFIDGRLGRGGDIRDNSSNVDAAFVKVESVYCNPSCPPPSVVSTTIQYWSGTRILDDYATSEESLWAVYRGGYTVYKVGRTTGITWGHLIVIDDHIVVFHPWFGYVFYGTFANSPGDSGGLVFAKVPLYREVHYVGLGTIVGNQEINGTTYSAAAPAYMIFSELGVSGYIGG